jgi:hypothetical protein
MMDKLLVTSLYDYYHTLALEHYQKYCVANDEYNKVCNNNQSFDYWSHSKEEQHIYISSWREKQKNCIISVVFEAMAVEAFINYIIVKTYSVDVFEKEYIYKSIWQKYKIIIKNNTGKEFEDYKIEYNMFSKLITIRNTMVHSKSEVFDIYTIDQQEFLNRMSGMFGGVDDNIFNSIDIVINTFDVLNKILK